MMETNTTQSSWSIEHNLLRLLQLEAFDIQVDFDVIRSKSELSFKNMVKKRALEYGLDTLLSKKEKHSKMDDLSYTELKL